MASYTIVAGWTSPIVISLLTKNATPSGTMAGMTAALILRDPLTGTTLDTSGDVTISDSTNWQVTYSPDAADLIAGIYRGRVKITDGSGLIAYFPSDDWDTWIVRTET